MSENPNQNSDVTIVVPCRNEERTLPEIYAELKRRGYNVLVPIAKSSIDGTKAVCEKLGIDHFVDSGGGKGIGLTESISHIKTNILVFFDADGSHSVEEIEPMVEKLRATGANMVIGSRIMGGSLELYDGSIESFLRTIFTFTINQIVNTRFGAHITDTQNGFRAARTASMRAITLTGKTFEIETEMIMKMLKQGMKIEEVPAREMPRKFGKSGVSIIRHGWRYIACILGNLL